MFKKDQEVWCSIFGKGTVITVTPISVSDAYPVEVAFPNCNGTQYYTLGGKWRKDGVRTLFFNKPKVTKKMLDPPWVPKEGEMVAVRDSDRDSWLVRKLRKVEGKMFICEYAHGTAVLSWRQAIPLSQYISKLQKIEDRQNP